MYKIFLDEKVNILLCVLITRLLSDNKNSLLLPDYYLIVKSCFYYQIIIW